MKNTATAFLLPLFVGLCLSSCDKVNDPYNTSGPVGGGDTTVVKVRKVLLEDYTGHRCGNCPPAAVTAQTLKTTYGEKLVVMTIHAGFFAEPKAAPYGYDFRNTVSDDYDNFFVDGAPNPLGMVNRREYPANNHIKDFGEWGTLVGAALSEAPDAHIEITNLYNTTSRQLSTKVRTEFLNPLTGDYKLAVLLVEDSIVKPQKFYYPAPGKDSLTYVHHHVLRDAISNDSWGDLIATGSVAAGDTVSVSLSYDLPLNFKGLVPRENHCYVVAYVYNATTYEVIQVEEKKIK